jgi:hypothetical protein
MPHNNNTGAKSTIHYFKEFKSSPREKLKAPEHESQVPLTATNYLNVFYPNYLHIWP